MSAQLRCLLVETAAGLALAAILALAGRHLPPPRP